MDSAGHVLVTANTLYARANSTSDSSDSSSSRPPVYKAIGIILAVCSGLFIGTSFVLKKTGLLKANAKYNEAAGEGYGYLKNVWWWSGMILMILGEVCNFVAYAFVDAILVTPFGALSVVITTVLSAIFLKERLSFVGKVGCFQCVIGAVIIALNAPEQSSAANIQQMQHYVIQPGFLSYTGVIIIGCAFTAIWAGPRYGNKSMFVYLTICSLIGGLSVVATQGLGAAIVAAIGHTTEVNQFKQWFLWVLFVFVICTLLTEIIYLNKALNIFNAALVTPTYYVYFTSATIITSAILFQGFGSGSVTSIISVVMGFFTICSGVVLLQLAKSSKDVPDSAVFKGDLDQVRTIAEQEEPESEPRADTIRGGAAIVRALSRKRTMRQLDEARTIASEHMEPIDENDAVYFDGLRRRKTVLSPGQPRPLQQTKTTHPPLGMTHFPGEHDSETDSDNDVHPGFLPRFRHSKKKSRSTTGEMPLTEMKPEDTTLKSHSTFSTTASRDSEREHIYGLPQGLRAPDHDDIDTSYKGGSAIQWTNSIDQRERERAVTHGSTLAPPKPPPHSRPGNNNNKRAFSFQNVFHRNKHDGDSEDSGSVRPLSRGALSFSSRKSSSSHHRPGSRDNNRTEEERMGLVTGDSSSPSGSQGHKYGGLPVYEPDDDDWLVTSGRSESPEDVMSGDLGRVPMDRSRSRSDDSDYDRYDDDELEYLKPKKPAGL